ncbi:MAG: YkuS family protein [Clostridia bacterium]|nr:YkuS family protein [Clostridia bacterium]
MPKVVAVEQGLTNVQQALQSAGYQVVSLENAALNNVQCIVVSGSSENMLGIQTTQTKAPVINARGLSAQEIVSQVEKLQ